MSFTSTLSPNTTVPFTPIIDPKCDKYYSNSTAVLVKDYDGIPENLLINIIAWIALLALYTFLRRIGDYGRFGLLKNEEERSLIASKNQRFHVLVEKLFGRTNPSDTYNLWASSSSSDDNEQLPTQLNGHDLNSNASSSPSTASDTSISDEKHILSSKATSAKSYYKDKSFFSWIINIIKLKDKDIHDKSGVDAKNYLDFQRILLLYLFIVTILSVSILLPLNITGKALQSTNKFGSTTIVNIDPKSSVLWVHLTLSWVYLVMGFAFMRFFSKKMAYTEEEVVSRTVFITGLQTTPKQLDKKTFNNAFQRGLPFPSHRRHSIRL